MAEAAALFGLVSSIASLVDLSVKVFPRLHEFASKTSDVPESFRSLIDRLPLLTVTLQRITAQAQTGRLPDDVMEALQAVVDGTSRQVSVVQACLSKILWHENASKIERAVKALKSLVKEDKVGQAADEIHKDIDFLVLHQTTQHVETGDRILEVLSKLTLATSAASRYDISIIFIDPYDQARSRVAEAYAHLVREWTARTQDLTNPWRISTIASAGLHVKHGSDIVHLLEDKLVKDPMNEGKIHPSAAAMQGLFENVRIPLPHQCKASIRDAIMTQTSRGISKTLFADHDFIFVFRKEDENVLRKLRSQLSSMYGPKLVHKNRGQITHLRQYSDKSKSTIPNPVWEAGEDWNVPVNKIKVSFKRFLEDELGWTEPRTPVHSPQKSQVMHALMAAVSTQLSMPWENAVPNLFVF